MKLLDKLKDALFEDDDEEEVAKQVDVEKTITKKDEPKHLRKRERESYEEFSLEDEDEFIKPFDNNYNPTINEPVIFDDEDFLSDTREVEFKEIPKKEEKILYKGNYEMKLEENKKEKFKPSPVISPVYGVLDKNYNVDQKSSSNVGTFSSERLSEKQKEIDFDTIRQKAFGTDQTLEDTEDDGLLYEMKDDDTPKINKVTLGDAEEYYDGLGLEYNVDYKIDTKNSKVQDKFITKFDEFESSKDDVEEKNLYDLIDLMYDGKDE